MLNANTHNCLQLLTTAHKPLITAHNRSQLLHITLNCPQTASSLLTTTPNYLQLLLLAHNCLQLLIANNNRSQPLTTAHNYFQP